MLINFGFVMSGTSACKYILGCTTVWGVPEIITKNIYIASQYVVYVYCCSWDSHGIIRAPKMSMQLQSRCLDTQIIKNI